MTKQFLPDSSAESQVRTDQRGVESSPQNGRELELLQERGPIPVSIEITERDIDDMFLWTNEESGGDPFTNNALVRAIRRAVRPGTYVALTLSDGVEEIVIDHYYSSLCPRLLTWMHRYRTGSRVDCAFGTVWIPRELVVPEVLESKNREEGEDGKNFTFGVH